MLSYPHDKEYCTPFTELVFDCASAEGLDIFLDRHRLRGGDEIDYACMLAMANALVVVPIISWSGLRRMAALTAESDCNYLLLEWTFALLLRRQGLRVLPIFVGVGSDGDTDPAANLLDAHPPRASDDGKSHALDAYGQPVPDDRSLPDRLPDVCVASVAECIKSFYRQQGREPPDDLGKLTARRVVGDLMKLAGVGLWNRDVQHTLSVSDELRQHWGLHEAVAARLVGVVSEAKRSSSNQPSAMFAKPAYPESVAVEMAQMKAMMSRQISHQNRLVSGMEEVKSGLKEVKSRVEDTHKTLARAALQLDFMVRGETECPQLFTLSPQSVAGVDKLNPATWLTSTLELRFLCAYDQRPVDPPVIIREPKEFMKQAEPAVVTSTLDRAFAVLMCTVLLLRVTDLK